MIQLFMTDPGENGGIGDLVAVEVEDGQNRPVPRRIEEFVGMPARRQRSSFRFTVADDAGNDQIGVVECRPIGVRDGIAEFAALVYRTGRLRRHVARDAAGERELGEQAFQPLLVARDVRINLTVGSLEIGVRNQAGPAMPRAGNVDHVEVVLLDHPVQVNVDEIETGCGSPMTQEPRLDEILCEWLLEQRVVVEIDLADRQVVCGPPVRIHQCPLLVGQRVCHHCLLVHVIGCRGWGCERSASTLISLTLARASVTCVRTSRSCAAYPFTVSTRLGIKSARRWYWFYTS